MRYLSVCAGIEAATVAWHPLGWDPVAFSEIDPFPSAVLAHHYPTVPNLGDMTKYKEWNIEPGTIDLLVGGTPCQSFSVAGLRRGLADPRGNLMLVYLGLLDRFRPRWMVWENVPGVLSSGGGRDFGAFLGGLAELGYGFAYRVLDAQYFGVAQRRRRVFVVGCLGDWRRAAAVLFERYSLSGNPPPSREAGKVAPTLPASGAGTGRTGNERTEADFLVMASGHSHAEIGVNICTTQSARQYKDPPIIAHPSHWDDPTAPHPTLNQSAHGSGGVGASNQEIFSQRGAYLVPGKPISFAQNTRDEVRLQGGDGQICGALAASPGMKQTTYVAINARQDPDVEVDLSPPMGRKDTGHAVAFTCSEQANGFAWERDIFPTLNAQVPNDTSNIQMGVRLGTAVRRLTPRECERLQGFPDDYTMIPWKGKPADECPDGPRYKALGNSMAVPVMHWIGKRIQMVEDQKTM